MILHIWGFGFLKTEHCENPNRQSKKAVPAPALENQRFAAAVRLVGAMSGRGSYCVCMSTDGICKFLEMADECRRRAERTISPFDSEAWLRPLPNGSISLPNSGPESTSNLRLFGWLRTGPS